MKKEHQEDFLGVKGGRCVRLTTLPPSWAIVTKSGNLYFLETSGYIGHDLLLHLLVLLYTSYRWKESSVRVSGGTVQL